MTEKAHLETQLETLQGSLNLINARLKKRTSFIYLFLYGVVQGIGTVIGATIVAGLLIAILARIIGTLNYIPVLDQLINQEQVQESFRQFGE